VLALFEHSFGHAISPERYRWKLHEHEVPFPTTWVAAAGERIVGHYAGYPLRFRLAGREVLAMHACDAVTAPDFRRQGILYAVGSAAQAGWREGGAALQIGLPTEWGSSRERLGWRLLFPLRWWRRPLRLDRVLARRRRLPAAFAAAARRLGAAWHAAWQAWSGRGTAGLQLRRVHEAEPAFDALWAALAPRYGSGVVRDAAWIRWRYLKVPEGDYQLWLAERAGQPAGYVVLRAELATGMGLIVDLFAAPDDGVARRALLRAALAALAAAGADEARVLAAAATPLADTARGAGFVLAPGAYSAGVVPLARPDAHELLADPARWWVMAGDFDVV
jgi:hypothetical protein